METLPIELIDDISDARLAPYVDLRHPENRTSGELFIAEGRLLLERLIASDYAIESVVVRQGFEHSVITELGRATPVYSLPRERLEQLVGFDFHRGVIACGKRRPLDSLDHFRFHGDDVPVALAVIGVGEQENLGSLFRSAAAFGIRHVLIGPATADPFSRRVLRVSMGNVLGLTLYRLDDPSAQLGQLARRMNLRSIATTLDDDATPLHDFVIDDRESVLIVGNESDGLQRRLQQAVSDRVTIPMQLGTDSLNVAVAAAVCMHQIIRNRPHDQSHQS